MEKRNTESGHQRVQRTVWLLAQLGLAQSGLTDLLSWAPPGPKLSELLRAKVEREAKVERTKGEK